MSRLNLKTRETKRDSTREWETYRKVPVIRHTERRRNSLTMDVCTDQLAISQDCPTEDVLINQQEIPQDWLKKDQREISEEWPTKESFIRREILKWRNISDEVCKIKKVKHRESKYGLSAILTLKTKCGDEFLVWAPKRLAEDLMEDNSYQFVYKIGLKTSSADGNEYFDYELM